MTNTVELNGKTYKVRTLRGERYAEVLIEDVTPGMRLDMGVFVSRGTATYKGDVNPNTWSVALEGGYFYTESRGASVRVWI